VDHPKEDPMAARTNDSGRKVALVTGANRGLGLAASTRLARAGYRVVLTARDLRAGEATAEAIRREVPGAVLDVMALDLASLASVRAFAQAYRERGLPLHLLLNNAGLLTTDALARSADGHELCFATNHLGHFLLTKLLEDVLVASAPARVVVVSSTMHIEGSGPGRGPAIDFGSDDLFDASQPYDGMIAYRNSKLANMWFSYALARRLVGTGVTVNALCPGFVPSTAVPTATGMRYLLFRFVFPWVPAARTVDAAAEHIAWVATAPELDGVSGRFYTDKAERRSSEPSYDEALQERLWALSERLVAGFVPEDYRLASAQRSIDSTSSNRALLVGDDSTTAP
jgi:NAD(P)-dependent dehydrogenase (short-subunit alcohol dehydrogenase family)